MQSYTLYVLLSSSFGVMWKKVFHDYSTCKSVNSLNTDGRTEPGQGRAKMLPAKWLCGCTDPEKKGDLKNSNKWTELISRLIKNMFALHSVWI